jgi:hypothetical protein
MRSLLFGVAVALMVTAPATALTTMSIEHAGSNDYSAVSAGETFEVTVVITTDENLGSFQLTFDDGGKGYTTEVGFGGMAFVQANYGDFDMGTMSWVNPNGWDVANAIAVNDGTLNPMFPSVNGMTAGAPSLTPPIAPDPPDPGQEPSGVSGWCFRMMVTAPDPLVNTVLTASSAEAGDIYSTDTLDGLTPLNLPEPASALFLLLGLPFLRRR